MRTVIKHGDAPAQVRSLSASRGQGRVQVASPKPTALDLAESEVLRLTQRIEALEQELATVSAEVPLSFERGRKEGFQAGKAAGDADHAVALGRVEEGVARAVSAYRDSLATLEQLAPLIAREGLRRVFADPTMQADLVMAAVSAQLAGLAQSAVVRVEVSRRDFTPEEVQSRLADPLSLPATRFDLRDDLPSGGCQIRLTLGALEVGPAQQWQGLERLLTDLARDGRG